VAWIVLPYKAYASRVMLLTKQLSDRILLETGIESSIDEFDMKEYVNQVLKEAHPEKA
jgi:hypothetical protein